MDRMVGKIFFPMELPPMIKRFISEVEFSSIQLKILPEIVAQPTSLQGSLDGLGQFRSFLLPFRTTFGRSIGLSHQI